MSLFSLITKINEFCEIPPPSPFILTPHLLVTSEHEPCYIRTKEENLCISSSIWEGNLATHLDVWSGIFATYSSFIIYLIWYFCYLDDKFPPIIGICHQINMYNVFEGNISHLSPFKTVPQYIFRFWSFLNDFLY